MEKKFLNENKCKQIFKDVEIKKQNKIIKKSKLENFFKSARGPKIFFEDENNFTK